MSARSPPITGLSWGTTEIEGHGSFKDVKLWPGGARAWDWRETGTRHEPGVQVADVEELVENGAEHVVISKGHEEALRVQPETIAWLQAHEVDVAVAPTTDAVAIYNELAARGERVGALVHSTC